MLPFNPCLGTCWGPDKILGLKAGELPSGVRISVLDAHGRFIESVVWCNRFTGLVERHIPDQGPRVDSFPAPLVFVSASGAILDTWRDLWVAGMTAHGIACDTRTTHQAMRATRLAFLAAARSTGLTASQWHARLDATPNHPGRYRLPQPF